MQPILLHLTAPMLVSATDGTSVSEAPSGSPACDGLVQREQGYKGLLLSVRDRYHYWIAGIKVPLHVCRILAIRRCSIKNIASRILAIGNPALLDVTGI